MTQFKQPVRWKYLITESMLILFGSYLLVVASTKTNQINPGILLINAVLLTLAAGFLALKSRADTGLEFPVAVMLGVMLAASLVSIDPRRSLGEFGLIAIPVTLFFLVCELVRSGISRELIIKAILAVGGIFMIFAWEGVGGWYLAWIKANPGAWLPDANFRLENPNLLAMVFNVWLMLAVARLLNCAKKTDRLILLAYVLSCLGIIFFTSSRGGWMASVAGLSVIGLVYFFLKREKWQPLWEKFKSNRRLVGLSLAAVALAVLAAGFILYRQLSHPSHGGRSEIWTPAIQAFLSSPVIGKGPFTFISAYLQANSVPYAIPYDYAHSIYFDLLSGTGFLGLAAFAWLMFSTVRRFLNRLRETSGDEWAVTLGAFAALATFLVHGFVDSTQASEPISLWNVCIVSAAALAPAGGNSKVIDWRKWFKVAIALAAAGLTWYAWWTLIPMKAGVIQASAGEWSAAAQAFDQAVRRDGSMAAAWQQAGLAQSMLADQNDPGALQKAIYDFERTVEFDPYWGLNQANLAVLYRAEGRLEDAKSRMERAVKLAPKSEIYHLNLGILQEEAGAEGDAAKTYAAALTLRPEWAGASFWRASALRREALEAWKADQPVSPDSSMDQLLAAVKARPDAIAVYLPVIQAYLIQGDLDAAERTFARAQFGAGTGAVRFELAWLMAEIAAEKGDMATAIDFGQDAIENATRYGIFGPATPGNAAYTLFMFRRPAAEIDLVPQMEVIRWPDKWGRRALTLAGWLEQSGNNSEAEKWRKIVAENIPDLQMN